MIDRTDLYAVFKMPSPRRIAAIAVIGAVLALQFAATGVDASTWGQLSTYDVGDFVEIGGIWISLSILLFAKY